MDCLIIGCGLCGMTVARTLADRGIKVLMIEKRSHIGGNIYDCLDSNGILVQKYGPHCFFTNQKKIKDYIEKFSEVSDCFVECRTVIDGMSIPMPFNFQSIDLLYSPDEAKGLKTKLVAAFPGRECVSVTDLLEQDDEIIQSYGKIMFEKEYKLYTAKQWGRSIESIDASVFHRVPVYLSYRKPYQSHKYQFIPKGGFAQFAKKMLESANIQVCLGVNALRHLFLNSDGTIEWKGESVGCPVLYTGALDELFSYRYGVLPYRSLEFVWKTLDVSSFQDTAIVAYPQADKITRITEYKKLPVQSDIPDKTVIAAEIPFEYLPDAPVGNEPYYPVVSDETKRLYRLYSQECVKFCGLFVAGRLADYRYYNMDDVILRAWEVAEKIYAMIRKSE